MFLLRIVRLFVALATSRFGSIDLLPLPTTRALSDGGSALSRPPVLPVGLMPKPGRRPGSFAEFRYLRRTEMCEIVPPLGEGVPFICAFSSCLMLLHPSSLLRCQ